MLSALAGCTTAAVAAEAPANKYTSDYISGAIVFVEGQLPKYIVFVFKDGKVATLDGTKCLADEQCFGELKLLTKEKRIVILQGDIPEVPDTKA